MAEARDDLVANEDPEAMVIDLAGCVSHEAVGGVVSEHFELDVAVRLLGVGFEPVPGGLVESDHSKVSVALVCLSCFAECVSEPGFACCFLSWRAEHEGWDESCRADDPVVTDDSEPAGERTSVTVAQEGDILPGVDVSECEAQPILGEVEQIDARNAFAVEGNLLGRAPCHSTDGADLGVLVTRTNQG